ARKGGVRPERPLSIVVIASFQGNIASPISAATVAMLGFLAAKRVSLPKLLVIIIPSTFIAVIVGALSVAWCGKNLADDPEYQRRLANGEVKAKESSAPAQATSLRNARGSMILFLMGIVAVVLIGLFP